ncbi:MAG: hypothetical protein ACJA2D_001623 [Pseudohongiellaceae bacterium]
MFAFSASQRSVNEYKLRGEPAILNREEPVAIELLSQSAMQDERIRTARDFDDSLDHHITAHPLNLEVANQKTLGDANEKVYKGETKVQPAIAVCILKGLAGFKSSKDKHALANGLSIK